LWSWDASFTPDGRRREAKNIILYSICNKCNALLYFISNSGPGPSSGSWKSRQKPHTKDGLLSFFLSMSSAVKLVRSATAKVVAPKKPSKPKAKTPVHHKETVVGVSEPASKAMTTFQSRVYALTQKIPKGYVTTYGAVAEILHSAPRAVGQALARNPFAPTVPWYVNWPFFPNRPRSDNITDFSQLLLM
jgi:hypothetical protein